jgi:hypothetical protein
MELIIDWIDEKRPAVLKISDCDHANDADEKLKPTIPHTGGYS